CCALPAARLRCRYSTQDAILTTVVLWWRIRGVEYAIEAVEYACPFPWYRCFFWFCFPRTGIVQCPRYCPFKRLSRRHDRHKDERTSPLLCYRFWKCDPLPGGCWQGRNGVVRKDHHRRQIHKTGLAGPRIDQKRLLPAGPHHPRWESGESYGLGRHDAQWRGPICHPRPPSPGCGRWIRVTRLHTNAQRRYYGSVCAGQFGYDGYSFTISAKAGHHEGARNYLCK